jgi:hypothetical protein
VLRNGAVLDPASGRCPRGRVMVVEEEEEEEEDGRIWRSEPTAQAVLPALHVVGSAAGPSAGQARRRLLGQHLAAVVDGVALTRESPAARRAIVQPPPDLVADPAGAILIRLRMPAEPIRFSSWRRGAWCGWSSYIRRGWQQRWFEGTVCCRRRDNGAVSVKPGARPGDHLTGRDEST